MKKDFRQGVFFLLLLTLTSSNLCAQSVTSIQPAASEVEKIVVRQAKTWNLTIDEWNRYSELRTLHHGLLSADLTPLEVLGILAETPEERRRYARLFASHQLKILQRIAEFEADYLEAVADIANSRPTRMQLVSEITCLTGPCAEPITEALGQARSGVGVDIYVLGAANDGAIRVWAARHLVPPDLVRSQVITLNHARQGMEPGLTHP